MRVMRRLAGGDPGLVADAAVAIAGATLTAAVAWDPPGLARVAGPPWLLVLVPLLVGAALAVSRRAPLLTWLGIWAGIALQNLVTRHPPPGLEFLFALFAGGYSLGAHVSMRRGAIGLAVTAPVMALISHLDGVGTGLSFLPLLAFWLAGVVVQARRRTASLARRNAALQRLAEQAAAAERVRIARELHDIVAHHLSVVVLQAAGARASGRPAGPTLEKIENSGRQALAETRRLLGVLRDPGQESGFAPQPGVGELEMLAGTVRAAGLPVRLVIDGDPEALPAAVDVSVYRIVQEALTNVLKHAGSAGADVSVACGPDAVTIEITDDGTGPSGQARKQGDQPTASGHGLAGMRERAAIFGGEFHAGPRAGGGFAVRARLPLAYPAPLADGASLPGDPVPVVDLRSCGDSLPLGDGRP